MNKIFRGCHGISLDTPQSDSGGAPRLVVTNQGAQHEPLGIIEAGGAKMTPQSPEASSVLDISNLKKKPQEQGTPLQYRSSK